MESSKSTKKPTKKPSKLLPLYTIFLMVILSLALISCNQTPSGFCQVVTHKIRPPQKVKDALNPSNVQDRYFEEDILNIDDNFNKMCIHHWRWVIVPNNGREVVYKAKSSQGLVVVASSSPGYGR